MATGTTPAAGSGQARAVMLSVFATCILLGAPAAPAAASLREREPAVAGAFYPGSPSELRRTVTDFLAEARPEAPEAWSRARPLAVIVPHAGYRFSGPTAAFAFKLLQGRPKPSRIVIIGPCHRSWLLPSGCSVADYSAFRTPLGSVELDQDACHRLAQFKPFVRSNGPHVVEHSVEVEIPFLQVIWPDTPKLVPIVVGELTPEQKRQAAAALLQVMDQDSLLVISSDFTHYGRAYGYTPFSGTPKSGLLDKIKGLDMEAVQHIEARDPSAFGEFLKRTGATICGRMGIGALLEALSSSSSFEPVFLRWANSAEQTADYAQMVSYVAMAVYGPPEALEEARKALAKDLTRSSAGSAAAPAAPSVTEEGKQALLKLARRAIEKCVENGGPGEPLKVNVDEMPACLRTPCGAFVTLTENGELRGCVGRIVGVQPLCLCVRDVAVLAATRDSRFKPVSKDELEDITIEISVLSPLEPVDDPTTVQVGRDGLLIRWDGRSGLLLPQVPVEFGWDRVEFLRHTCRKAGLPPEAWKWKDARLFRFTATVFSERDPRAANQPRRSEG